MASLQSYANETEEDQSVLASRIQFCFNAGAEKKRHDRKTDKHLEIKPQLEDLPYPKNNRPHATEI